MGYQIIKQPDGELYGLFSSSTDTIVAYDCTRQEIIDFFVEEATEEAIRSTTRILAKVDLNDRPYYQFTKTWEQAVELDREHGGEYSKEE